MINLNWQIIYTIINLLVLYVLLKRFLFRPVTAMMDKRAKMVEESFAEAAKEKEAAQQEKEAYAAKLKDAQVETAAMITEAKKNASLEYDRILKEAREDAQKEKEKAVRDIERERETAMEEVKASISQVALLAASKLAEKNIDETSGRQFVEEFLSEAGEAK